MKIAKTKSEKELTYQRDLNGTTKHVVGAMNKIAAILKMCSNPLWWD